MQTIQAPSLVWLSIVVMELYQRFHVHASLAAFCEIEDVYNSALTIGKFLRNLHGSESVIASDVTWFIFGFDFLGFLWISVNRGYQNRVHL